MQVVVAYDISDDDTRSAVATLLSDILGRVQYSVFEGSPPDDALAAKVEAAAALLDPETDSLRVYRMCRTCAGRVEVFGRAPSAAAGPVTVL